MKHPILLFFLFHTLLFAHITRYETGCSEAHSEKFRILDSVEVRFAPLGGIPFEGISDLAYDTGHRLLYAVSDRGWLYRLKLLIKDRKIQKLELTDAMTLTDAKGNDPDGKKWRDAEGMTLTREGLLVAFERRPRIVLYTPDGRFVEKAKLPKPLKKAKRYRGKNKMLESVAWHPRYGIVTAPERPLKQCDASSHTIYSKKKRWEIPASGSLTAIETTAKGDILILERDYDWLTGNRTLRLSLVRIAKCKKRCIKETVAVLRTTDGCRLDNFEGLTRVDKDRYLMISDDNGSPFQKTLLVLFEISE